jgi:Protein of unknown function (DUF1552)
MKSKIRMWTRRRLLRGILAGSAVTVGLPILDCVLNDNGTAFADTGALLPTRFVAWFWGLGIGEESHWVPKNASSGYELPWRIAALKPFQNRMNLFTGSQVFLDGAANETHFTGVQGYMTGKVSAGGEYLNSADGNIANTIGARSRFRALSCTPDEAKSSWTAFASGKVPGEVSPLALYRRIFGPGFTDPNASTFVPDPKTMVHQSVLSGISEERAALDKSLGAADRQKLDYYFTALRSLEQKLDIELQKPAPLPACTKPEVAIEDNGKALTLATELMARYDLFGEIVTHALACDQTRVANLAFNPQTGSMRRDGEAPSHHVYTHEEPIDPKLGYQVHCAWFQQLEFEHLYKFATMLDGVKEGDRSLLDHTILWAYTDHVAPRVHSLHNYAFITIGDGNRRIKTGMHFPMPGDAATRMTLTIQQAMGVPISSWGTGSNHVTSPISGVLA